MNIAFIGETVAYFNLSSIFPNNASIEEGNYNENDAIRSATLAQKFKTMTLIVFDKYNATKLSFKLKGKSEGTDISVSKSTDASFNKIL